MVYKDNLILNMPNGDMLFMNLITFRRKKVSAKYRNLIMTLVNKRKNYTTEEIQFIKDLEVEKQILPKEQVKLYENELVSYYNSLIDSKKDRVPFNIILTYSCNSNCIYCYQKQQSKNNSFMSIEQIDAIDAFYNKYSKFFNLESDFLYDIFITGGEPFLKENMNTLDYIFNKWENSMFSFSTNGVNIPKVIDRIPISKIDHFKISLDGIDKIHNKRRPLINGEDSFDKVIKGIDIAIENNIHISLKITTDSKTIEFIPELFEYMDKKNWLNNPLIDLGISGVFSYDNGITLDKRFNTSAQLVDGIKSMRENCEYINNIKNNMFYGTGILRNLLVRKTNLRYIPSIYRCSPLLKNNYTFNPTGNIYLCSSLANSGVGKIGEFYPKQELDINKVKQLRERNVLKMDRCKKCIYRFVCCGGCLGSAYLKSGKFMDEDCGYFADNYVMDNFGEMFL